MRNYIFTAAALLCINITSAQELSPQIRGAIPASRPYIKAETVIKNDTGLLLYKINFNPFIVEDYRKSSKGIEIEKIIDAKVQEELAVEAGRSEDSSRTPLSYQHAGVVIATQAIQNKYGVKFTGVQSSLDYIAYLYADTYSINRIIMEDSVAAVREVDQSEFNYNYPKLAESLQASSVAVQSSSSDTLLSGGEYRSWAHNFLYSGSGSGSYSNNPVYVVDGSWIFKLSNGATVNGRHYVPSESYNIPIDETLQTIYTDPMQWYGGTHALAITGIINARQNGYGTVGINPGQPVYHYTADKGLPLPGIPNPSPTQLNAAINSAFQHSESQVTWPTLTFSLNASGQQLDALGSGGLAFRQASNRFLVTHSAGNSYDNACVYAYNHSNAASPNDGIMVVGGLNISGQRWSVPNPLVGGSEQGSNNGPCVDVWAPAHEISTTTYWRSGDSVTAKPRWIASGTSFSAPMTAALASRLGTNSSTRPLVREWLIRKGAGSSGRVNWANIPNISTVPALIPYSVTGVSNNLTDTYALNDGKYVNTGHWSPLSNSGWVSVGFGGARRVDGIRFTLRTSDASGTPGSPPGGFEVAVWQRVGGVWLTQTNKIELKQANNVPIYVPLNYPSTTEILVWGVNQSSWFAMSELEVYGQ